MFLFFFFFFFLTVLCVFPFMASVDDLWARFSLFEEEERGADVPREKEASVYRLVGRFFTKRVVNAKAITCTFKPL